MEYKVQGKDRWIFKFKLLCSQRIFIFRLLSLLVFLFVAIIVIVVATSIKYIYYVFPLIILPISMIYPHVINKRRLEQLYVDLPKEIKPDYEGFVKRYAKYLFLIQFVFKNNFFHDQNKIIEMVKNYNGENKNP